MKRVCAAALLSSLAACTPSSDGDVAGDAWFVDEAVGVETVEDAVRSALGGAPMWEHLYQSDHGETRTELEFGAGSVLHFVVDSWDIFLEPPESFDEGEGTWEVDERGVVRVLWSADEGWGWEEERTYAPLDDGLATLLREQNPHDRQVWTSTGYLAQDASLTTYHHRFWKKSESEEKGGADGILRLSAAPLELAAGAPCTLELELEIRNRDDEGTHKHADDCVVDEVDGYFRIRSAGIEPEASVVDWDAELKERGLYDELAYGVFAAIRDVGFPVFWFDPARPEVLVTEGYSETLTGFEPEDHEP